MPSLKTPDALTRAELPNASSVLIGGADHFLLLEAEQRPAWSRAILEVLGSQPPPS